MALGFQLYSLGYVDDPQVPVQGELCRVFEDLFDEHGDTLALQYAGSQLVHSIKTYKKTSAFQVGGRRTADEQPASGTEPRRDPDPVPLLQQHVQRLRETKRHQLVPGPVQVSCCG